MISFHNLDQLSDNEISQLYKRSEQDIAMALMSVEPIIRKVAEQGDTALFEATESFDQVDIRPLGLKITEEEIAAAETTIDKNLKESIYFAADNIRRFHERQKPEAMWMHEMHPGVWAGEKYEPIPSVACYVPRGKGCFPSVFLMTTIPAKIAEVPNIIVLTPPAPNGGLDDATLIAAKAVGIKDIYRVGGAQAVAAAAYGTATIPKVSKIVGPGSSYVVAAKKKLQHLIDTGLPAGPSEALIFADGTVPATIIAKDLLVEAEHGSDSSAFLVTTDKSLADEVKHILPQHIKALSEKRQEFVKSVLSGPRGGILYTRSLEKALHFINEYAPEHLLVDCQDAMNYLPYLKNAGEILLGPHTPIPLGNFVLGPNAILPTSKQAKTWSPLSVFDFMKRISIGINTKQGYDLLAPHAHRLAEYEGFDAHALAVNPQRYE